MTSRERVLAAIRHEPPDRAPRDFWAETPAMRRLFAHLGHSDEERLLQRLGIDIRHINAVEPEPTEIIGGIWQNHWGERFIYQRTPWGPMREDTRGALANSHCLADFEAFPWPAPDDFNYSKLCTQCARFSEYALVYGFADIWQRPALARGWEDMMLDMVERPEWVHLLCRKFTDFYLEDYSRAAEESSGRIDIYLVISDLGTQRGLLMSPGMFREFVAPYLREMTDLIHGLGARVMFHSCGLIHALIPDLIEIGIDILDPIQPLGPEMSPERLREDFGDALCFHGGIDMQHLLPMGSPEDVRAEARRYCEVFSDSGGYILGPAHLFQPDVPPENVLAMYGV